MPEWFSLTNAARPLEDSDAGDATEWVKKKSIHRIQSARRAARREFDAAKHWLHMNRTKSEVNARRALRLGAEAYWFAELTELAEREHRTLHAMGRWTAANFDCWLDYENGSYSTSCPVAIADVRMGFSPGFAARRMCSICDGDLSECPHLRGRLYWVRGSKHSGGYCRVCASKSCNHRDHRLYKTCVIGIIKEVDVLREVSVVDVPAQPLARLTKRAVSLKAIADAFGPGFVPGVKVGCTSCSFPYPGLPIDRATNLATVLTESLGQTSPPAT
ncbi:hypothetical protein ABZ799_28455 [Nocardiopsis dassonvillei]|uniref:hypothetical protein n=1 Tax=Nocardiopsis dassonvillei TaxID=2014 RepID=UPI0033E76743